MDEIIKKIELLKEEPIDKSDVCTFAWNKAIDATLKIIQYDQPKPLTIGDKTRETNESLAEFMEPLMHCEECTMDLVDDRPLCNGGTAVKCKQRILDYFNQPSTGTARHQTPAQ